MGEMAPLLGGGLPRGVQPCRAGGGGQYSTPWQPAKRGGGCALQGQGTSKGGHRPSGAVGLHGGAGPHNRETHTIFGMGLHTNIG